MHTTLRRGLFALAACSSLVSAACSKTDSSELETNAIRADLSALIYDNASPEATADPPTYGSYMGASFDKGDTLAVVDLSAGDDIYVATNLNPKTPMKHGDFAGDYITEHLDLSGLTTANFVFTRTSKASAPNSKVAVPAAIAMTAPTQNATVSLSSGKATFTWSNPVPDAMVSIYVHVCNTVGTVATTSNTTIADTGSYEVKGSDIVGGLPTGSTCYLATVERRVTGTPDPAWRSGSRVYAIRTLYLSFTGTP